MGLLETKLEREEKEREREREREREEEKKKKKKKLVSPAFLQLRKIATTRRTMAAASAGNKSRAPTFAPKNREKRRARRRLFANDQSNRDSARTARIALPGSQAIEPR